MGGCGNGREIPHFEDEGIGPCLKVCLWVTKRA